MISKSTRSWFVLLILLVSLVASSVLTVKAQGGMGQYGLTLNPKFGSPGTKVSISFDVRDFMNTNGGLGTPQDKAGTTYRIGWDIGGWPTSAGAGLDAVRSPGWTVLGTADLDRNGVLTTTVTVPSDAQNGDDHYIYAIPPNTESGFYYWWGFFEVIGGAAPTPTPTPGVPSTTASPVFTLYPLTTPTPPPGAGRYSLEVDWNPHNFDVSVYPTELGNPITPSLGTYLVSYDQGTIVTLHCTYLAREPWRGFAGWKITNETSERLVPAKDVTIVMDSDTEATPTTNGCFIATATYGSELSPEVQFLRNFRQTAFINSFTGTQFVNWFNTVYYSFSPSVASAVSSSETSRNWMKGSLYPMMGILHFSADAYSLFSFSPDLGIVVFVLLSSFLMSLVYLTPALLVVLTPILVLKKASISMGLIKKACLVLSGCMFAILVAAVGKVPLLMMGSGAALVGVMVCLTNLVAVKLLSEHWISRTH